MRIALIPTLGTVKRGTGGSIESVVWLLGRELTRLGHEVTTFGTAGSEVAGELVATLPGPYGQDGSPYDWQLCEWINHCRAVEQSARFDVLHSHAYLWGLPLDRLSRAAMVHTTHILPDADSIRLRRMYPNSCVTAISHYQWQAAPPELRPTAVIGHGVDAEQFTFSPEPQDYACFLGRFMGGKGPLLAIAAARRLGLRLLLAGPPNAYFREKIEPEVDGHTIEYVGRLLGTERDSLLGGARALLYPIKEPEPFGLVLPEAMMCGTPVAAVAIGAVPEIIDEGVTGCLASSPDDFDNAVLKALALDRRIVREKAMQRFSARPMTERYLAAYEKARHTWSLSRG